MNQVDQTPPVAVRKGSRNHPAFALVDDDYEKSIANIPRAAWEPLAYLESESQESKARCLAMVVPGCRELNGCLPPEGERYNPRGHEPGCLEWARQAALVKWGQVEAWLREVRKGSPAVEALRSWQLMEGLKGHQPGQQRPSSTVMPDFNQPTPPGPKKRNGILAKKEPTP